jgi:parallel beta-helix repeat protein
MSKTKWHVKPIYVLVGIALVLSVGIAALPMAGTVEANECCEDTWVDDNAGPDWYNVTCHFHTIQQGVDAVCEGGTVHVLPGEYDGGIAVNKTGVTIESTDGPDITIVQNVYDNGFVVTAQGVIIDGFKITGFDGGTTSPSPEGTGHSPQNYKYSGCGIILAGVESADNCTIRNNIIENNCEGILIFTDNNQILYNNILSNIHEFSGVHLSSCASGNEIHCNNILGNLGYGVLKEEYDYCAGPGMNGATVDATKNYWGCSEGPGAAGCDTFDGNVLVHPWLPMPFEQCEECGGTPPTVVPKVPSLSQWAMVALISLFAGMLVWTVRRRQVAS